MREAHQFQLKGTHITGFLLIFAFTTIFLLCWEENPFSITLRSAKQQFMFYASDETITRRNSPSTNSTKTESIGMHALSPTSNNSSACTYKSGRDGRCTVNSTLTIQECNYGKGEWIVDNTRPLYYGSGCKQWLSKMWACKLTQRSDFSYEVYRWKPENCQMENFEKSSFLRRMQDKTIAFVGDSLGRQQFQSLICMATGGEQRVDVGDVGSEYGLVKPPGAKRPDGWAYHFSNTNTTILFYWSATLSNLEPLNMKNPTTEIAMHLDQPPTFLREFFNRFDVLVLNTGHHWNIEKFRANRWVMYANGKPIKDVNPLGIDNAKNFTIHNVVKWVNTHLNYHPQLKAFFRTISPRHFRNGDWNTGGNCDNTIPLTMGNKVTQDESNDGTIAAAVNGTKVKLLDITALSELRDEGHISRYSFKATQGTSDCLHWCLPGIPDTWNEILVAQL